jgi:hypothetical protein
MWNALRHLHPSQWRYSVCGKSINGVKQGYAVFPW